MLKSAIVATFALMPAFVHAQEQRPPIGSIPYFTCAPVEQLSKNLTEKYGENPIFAWTTSPIHLNRLWVNAVTGSTSVTRTNIEQDIMCILNEGHNGQEIELPKPATF